jgi:hypothetical protein
MIRVCTRENLFCVGVKLSFNLREEHRPRVFENRVLKRVFRPKVKEVTGGWRKLHMDLLNLYSSLDILPCL